METIPATFELSLAATAAAPTRARRGLTAWLGDGARDRAFSEVVQLLVSELVTNCVRHARTAPDTPLRVTASVRGQVLRIAVHDRGVEGTITRRAVRRRDDVGGFGLDLVDRLSSAWGIDRNAGGTTVWLELAMPPP